MKKIDICLTPDLIGQFDLNSSVVVVIDILRATSSITTGIAHGVEALRPVNSLAECKKLMEKGYIGAAERGGKKVGGFELGNSPFDFMNPALENKRIAITTTNGTAAMQKSRGALQIIIGSFLNYAALLSYLERLPCDVLLLCAGWKGKVNLEDTIFAGALTHGLHKLFEYRSDAPLMAMNLYKSYQADLQGCIEGSSHAQRLRATGQESDINFCFQRDQYKVIPVMKGDYIHKMKIADMLF